MTPYADIFRERVRLDLRQQPFVSKHVVELADWFRASPTTHPYDAPSLTCPLSSYQLTCTGPLATLPRSEYIYRLSNVRLRATTFFPLCFPCAEVEG